MTSYKKEIVKKDMLTSNKGFSDDQNAKKKYYTWFILAGIVTITLIVYSPIFNNELLNWDDNVYVTQNPQIQGLHLKNLEAFFTNYYQSSYIPLTMISFAIDYQIGGLNPQVYTGTNLLLHIINSLLVFWIVLFILKLYIKKTNENYKPYLIAAITALFFALHPLNVESVAWVSERKNLMFSLFFLLSLIFYVKYINENKFHFYLISILLFICSLFSKGVAVSLSLTVVAIDYLYKREIFSKRVLLEKIPYFILSLIFGIITINISSKIGQFQQHPPFYDQFAFAWYGFMSYLYKLFLPVNLSAFYMYPKEGAFGYWLCFALVVLIAFIIIKFRKSLPRIIIFAVLFYVVNIIFLIQLLPVGNAIMAERYIYISSIGFFLIVSIIVLNLARKFSLVYILLGISFVLYGFTTHERIKVWNNSFSFCDEMIKYDNNNPYAWNNRGVIKKDNSDYSGALDDYSKAIELLPTYGDAYFNKGNVERIKGDFENALNDYNMAIKIMPDNEEFYFCRGIVYYSLQNIQEAYSDFSEAIKIDPRYEKAYFNRAIIKSEKNDYSGALDDYNKAINYNPSYKEAYNYRGIIFFSLGKLQESYNDFSKAIELDPEYAEAYYNRGKLLSLNESMKAALVDLDQAIILDSKYLEAYILRANIKIKLGDKAGASQDILAAKRLGYDETKN